MESNSGAPADNILEFPETFVRQWLPYERMVRQALSMHSLLSADRIEELLGRLRPIYLHYAQNAQRNVERLPAETDMLERVQAWVAGVTAGLLIEIAVREDKLT